VLSLPFSALADDESPDVSVMLAEPRSE